MGLLQKLTTSKTVKGYKFQNKKVGIIGKMQGRLEAKIRRKMGMPAAQCGGATIKDIIKSRAKARRSSAGACGPNDSACNAGVARVDCIGIGALVTLIVLAAAVLLSGCATQPSRSQTQIVRDNVINVFVSPRLSAVAVCDTNVVPSGAAGGDVLCQAMMIETGGSESNNQNASTDPALNLPVGDTAVSALGELIGSAITGGVKAATKTEDQPVAQ